MLTLADQLGSKVTLPHPPQRIVSLVPSQTELLFHLGLNQQIAGITKFCIHPEGLVKDKLKIGGTKNLDIALIQSLNPDLIIANKEENERAQVEELMHSYPIYVSDPYNLATALQMIADVGFLVGRGQQAVDLTTAIKNEFGQLKILPNKRRVAYFIWRKPYMAAGTGTFINSMLQYCGFVNAFNIPRYPQVSIDMLRYAAPDLILLSSEPYPFRQKHIDELAGLLPNVAIKLVDGEMFSWYGSRLLKAIKYFSSLINSINQ